MTPSFSPPGVPLSPTPTEVPLTPQPVVERVAYLRKGDIWLVDVDGGGSRRLGLTDIASFEWVTSSEIDADSTDGRHLLIDLDGTSTELAFPSGGSWSHDGKRYATPVDQRIVLFSVDGETRAELTAGPSCDGPMPGGQVDHLVFGRPVFTQDDASVLVAAACFSDTAASGNLAASIYEVATNGSGERALANFQAELESVPGLALTFPRSSPDGRWLIQGSRFHANICAETLSAVVATADGTHPRLLSLRALQALPPGTEMFGGVIGFDWSPSSDAIAASFDVSICDRSLQPKALLAGLYVVSLNGGDEDEIVGGSTHEPSWSPSGRFVVCVRGSFLDDGTVPAPVLLIDLITGTVSKLARGSHPAWQPGPQSVEAPTPRVRRP